MRILRKREVLERLGNRKTAFHDLFVMTGKLRPVNIRYPRRRLPRR